MYETDSEEDNNIHEFIDKDFDNIFKDDKYDWLEKDIIEQESSNTSFESSDNNLKIKSSADNSFLNNSSSDIFESSSIKISKESEILRESETASSSISLIDLLDPELFSIRPYNYDDKIEHHNVQTTDDFSGILCDQCGIRFLEKTEAMDHISDHARFNKALMDKNFLNRNYFILEDKFLTEHEELELPKDMPALVESSTTNLHKQRITSLVTPNSSGSAILISTSRDKTVKIWSHSSDGLIIKNSFENFGSFVNEAVTDNTNSKIVIVTENRHAFIVDVNSQKRIVLNGHTGSIKCCDIDAGSTHIATGSTDGTIKIWNTEGECIYDLPSTGSWVVSLKFMFGRSDQIIAGYSDGRVRIIDIKNNNCIFTFLKGSIETESSLNSIKTAAPRVSSITITGDGPFCAYSTWEGIFYILNLENQRNVFETNCNSQINSISFCAIKPYLAVATKNEVMIFDVSKSKKIVEKEIPKSNECLSVCWVEGSVICGFKNGEITILDLGQN
nr:guanine nucleotide-binding protein subunit beta-like protein [Lepeophtheirus salmonis]